MSAYKKFCFGFLAMIALFWLGFLALCVLLWLYDPFMFFHKPYFREWTFASDRRLVVKGMVDFVEFDSAIFGSSMLENTLSKEADEKIGGKWLNLAINSSRIYEREALIQYILKHKQIKQIIYALENYFLVKGEFDEDPKFTPLNLNRSFWQNFKIYLDKHFIKCALKWSKEKECVGRKLNTFADWYSKDLRGFENWHNAEKEMFVKELKLYENNNYKVVEFRSVKMQKYIKEHILVYAEQNPQINFYFVLPTQSRFFWKIPYFWNDSNFGTNASIKRSSKQYYADWKVMIKWFIQESAKYPNVKIYGLDDLDYADSLDNYTDARHYNPDMNSLQLDAIANGTHILTPENIDKYLQTMENKIKSYDIAPLINEIKEWEKNSSKSQ